MSVVFKVNIYNADPEKCYSEIQSLGESFTPEQVVDIARDSNTELHKCFTWDDTKAAEKWRREEARHLIANIVYTKDEETREPSLIRAISFSDTSKSFKPTSFIVRKQDEYEDLLAQAKHDLEVFERKYVALGDLEQILALIC